MSLKIVVAMWYDEGIKEYGDLNYIINKCYCDKHGYEIVKSSETRYENNQRSKHWERLPLLLDLLSKDNPDYVVWIDADAHFYIDAPPLDLVINRFPTRKLILSGDLVIKNMPWEINSGFFIVKNCKECVNILKEWAYSDSLKNISDKHYIYGNFNDQQVIRYMYDKNILNVKNESVVIPYGKLQHFYKNDKNVSFIRHLAGFNKIERINHCREYYKSIIRSRQKPLQDKSSHTQSYKKNMPLVFH